MEPIRLICAESIRDIRLQEWLVGMIVLHHSFGAGNLEDCRIRGCRPRRDRENSSTCGRWNIAGCPAEATGSADAGVVIDGIGQIDREDALPLWSKASIWFSTGEGRTRARHVALAGRDFDFHRLRPNGIVRTATATIV